MNMWRVDMHRSLQTLETVTKKRRQAMWAMRDELLGCVQYLLPTQSVSSDDIELVQSILTDTWDLAKDIRLSTGSYHWVIDVTPTHSFDKRIMRYDELKKCAVIDVSTGQPARNSSIQRLGPEAKVGEKLCTVRPALFRKGREAETDLLLVKSTIIVRFDEGIRQDKKKFKKGPLIDFEEDATQDNKDGGVDLGEGFGMDNKAYI